MSQNIVITDGKAINIHPNGPDGLIVTVRPSRDGKVKVDIVLPGAMLDDYRLTIPALSHGSTMLQVEAIPTKEDM